MMSTEVMSPWCRAIVAASADRIPGPLSVRTSMPIVSLAKVPSGSSEGLEADAKAEGHEEPSRVDLHRVRLVHRELDRGAAVAHGEGPSHLPGETVLDFPPHVEAHLALALREDGHARDRDGVEGEGVAVLGLPEEARLHLEKERRAPEEGVADLPRAGGAPEDHVHVDSALRVREVLHRARGRPRAVEEERMRELPRELRGPAAPRVGADHLAPHVVREEVAQPDLPPEPEVVGVVDIQAALLGELRERPRLAELELGGEDARVEQEDEPRARRGHGRGGGGRLERRRDGGGPRRRRGRRLHHRRWGRGRGGGSRRGGGPRGGSGAGRRRWHGREGGLSRGHHLHVRPADEPLDTHRALGRGGQDPHRVPVPRSLHHLELGALLEAQELERVGRAAAVDRSLGRSDPEMLRRLGRRETNEEGEDRQSPRPGADALPEAAHCSTPTASQAWTTARSGALFAPKSSRAEMIEAMAASPYPELGTSFVVKAR